MFSCSKSSNCVNDESDSKTTWSTFKTKDSIPTPLISKLITYFKNDFKKVKSENILLDKEFLILNYVIKKRGFYDVHILYNNKVVCTYAYKVK